MWGYFDLARIIHDGSWRNCQDAKRDGHAEPYEAEAYLKQYVEVAGSELARLAAGTLQPSPSQRRLGNCSGSVPKQIAG